MCSEGDITPDMPRVVSHEKVHYFAAMSNSSSISAPSIKTSICGSIRPSLSTSSRSIIKQITEMEQQLNEARTIVMEKEDALKRAHQLIAQQSMMLNGSKANVGHNSYMDYSLGQYAPSYHQHPFGYMSSFSPTMSHQVAGFNHPSSMTFPRMSHMQQMPMQQMPMQQMPVHRRSMHTPNYSPMKSEIVKTPTRSQSLITTHQPSPKTPTRKKKRTGKPPEIKSPPPEKLRERPKSKLSITVTSEEQKTLLFTPRSNKPVSESPGKK